MKKIFVVTGMAILASLLLLPSCSPSSPEKSAEKMMEKTLESGSGQETDVDINKDKITIETEGMKTEIDQEARSWPSGIPAGVPKPKEGKILRTSTTQATEADNWTVVYEDISTDMLDSYEAELKKAGFKTMIMKMGDAGTVTGEKAPLIVSLIIGKKGEAILSVVSQKGE